MTGRTDGGGGTGTVPAAGTVLADLPGPYRDLAARAAALARRVEPLAVEADASSALHPGVLSALRGSGLCRLVVPARHGGDQEQVDPLAVCVVREQLMATCSHLDSLFALQGIGSYALALAGTPEQRDAWLPAVASGEVLAAFAVSEPGAGSDLKALSTTATAKQGRIVLAGRKSFISNAGVAGFYTVLAREGDGFSTFVVPAGTPGLSVEPAPELGAPHVLGDVVLDAVTLDDSARVGDPGAGLDLVLATLSVFRVSVAGAAVGLSQTALEEAVRHARRREQFGRPLLRHGPVAGLLADSWADVAATRLLAYEAARRAGEDPRASLELSSLAKLAATEACCRVVDRCVQVMGRFGLVRDSRIERCYRQARPMRVYEGASEVLRLGIARHLAGAVE